MHIFDHDYFISGIDISKLVKIITKVYVLEYKNSSTKVAGVFQMHTRNNIIHFTF